MSTDAFERASAAIADVADPDNEVETLVPSLLSGLDADDRKTRVSSAWATCIVASAAPEAVGPLAHGLVEKLLEDHENEAVRRTLATLHEDAEPTVVREALAAVAGEKARPLYKLVVAADPWDIDDVLDVDEDDERDVPIRRLIRTDDETARAGSAGHVQRSDAPGADTRGPSTRRPDADGAETPGPDATADREPPDYEPDDPEAARKRQRIREFAESDTFATIEYHADFEEVTVTEPRTERRYTTVVRTRARVDGEETGVDLRLFETPDDAADFEATLAARIARWAEVGDVPGVVSVRDHGERPRPWVGAEYVDEPLCDHARRSVSDVLWDARALTGALADVHQRGVVHGGIDPRNVVYGEAVMDSPARPMLDNVGLLFALRDGFSLSSLLDPRYAAPEYYDEKYGTVDCATDIYQLGATLYRLFTGEHPYDGDYAAVREGVLSEEPPQPTEAEPKLPDALDDVVAKAMAPAKLARYDTAVRFHREVASLCDRLL